MVQDYKQQRPSQELVAKDLHGLEWRFRHIYRGTLEVRGIEFNFVGPRFLIYLRLYQK